MNALSQVLIESTRVPLDYVNKEKDERYSVKSLAKWVSADCEKGAPTFPKIK